MHRTKQRNYSIDRFVPNWHTVQQSHAQRAARGERWSSAMSIAWKCRPLGPAAVKRLS